MTQFSVAVAGLPLHILAYTGIISMSLLIAVNLWWSSSDVYKSLQLTFVRIGGCSFVRKVSSRELSCSHGRGLQKQMK